MRNVREIKFEGKSATTSSSSFPAFQAEKVMFTLERTTKAQRGNRCIALPQDVERRSTPRPPAALPLGK